MENKKVNDLITEWGDMIQKHLEKIGSTTTLYNPFTHGITYQALQHESKINSDGVVDKIVLPQVRGDYCYKFLIVDTHLHVEIVISDVVVAPIDDKGITVREYNIKVTMIDFAKPDDERQKVLLCGQQSQHSVVLDMFQPQIKITVGAICETIDGFGDMLLCTVAVCVNPAHAVQLQSGGRLSCPWILYGSRIIENDNISTFLEDVGAGMYDNSSIETIDAKMKEVLEYCNQTDDDTVRADLLKIVDNWNNDRLLPVIVVEPITDFVKSYHPETDAEVSDNDKLRYINGTGVNH